ncbi:hypothetical protein C8J57DRAFT_1465850 [Mycena rebaudengoi]|nr:hypothetical protein C8J57DRAFT_1465850 [Mycena rebaudengoi]
MPLLSSLVSALAVSTLASAKAVPLSSRATSCCLLGIPIPICLPLLTKPCTSPPPTGPKTQTCFIHITDTNGIDYGYLKPEWSDLGLYNQFNPTTEDALKVSFEYSPSAPTGFSMKAVNNPTSQAAFPFLGGATCSTTEPGDDDGFIDGPSKFGCLVGTSEPPSDKNSLTVTAGQPDSVSETAIWNYDSDTRKLTTQWINPNAAAGVATQIVFANDFGRKPLVLTNDPDGFDEKFNGNLKYPKLIFTCEPTTS